MFRWDDDEGDDAQGEAGDGIKKRFLWPSLRSLELLPLQDGGVDRESLLEIVHGTPNLTTLDVATSAQHLSVSYSALKHTNCRFGLENA